MNQTLLASNTSIEEIFLTKEKFSKEVEDFVVKTNSTYLEAIVFKMEEKGIEYERAKKFLTPSVVEKLEVEAADANLVKRTRNVITF